MSLETLLEAAKFLERRSQRKTRGAEKHEFHQYAKSAPPPDEGQDEDGDRERADSASTGDEQSISKDKRRAGGAGTREVHNKLEKNRRAHLKECFDMLKKDIPNMDDKKISNLSILRGALRYIQVLKRKEKEFEQEMQRLAREKIALQERILQLRRELTQMNIDFDINHFMTTQDQETNSTTTATECGSPIMSEDEEEAQGLVTPSKPMVVTTTVTTTPQATKLVESSLSGLIKATGAVVHTTNKVAAPVRPPVTQILQQTLAQRAIQSQLQLQQKLQQQQQQALSVAANKVVTLQAGNMRSVQMPGGNVRLVQPPGNLNTTRATGSITPIHMGTMRTAQSGALPFQTGTLRPITGTIRPLLPQLQQAVALRQLASVSSPSSSITTTVSSAPSHTVSVINARASAPHTTSVLASQLNALSKVVLAPSSTNTATVPAMSQTTIQTPATVTLSAAASQSGGVAQIPGMKQIIATPAQFFSTANHLSALSQLMAQAIPRTTVGQILQSGNVSVTSGQVARLMTPSAAHQGLTSLGQIPVSPVAMVTPAVHLPSGLTPAQLGSVVGQQVLKQVGQIPLLQPAYLQSVTQPLVKPVVMVSVPSVVTSSSTGTGQVAVSNKTKTI